MTNDPMLARAVRPSARRNRSFVHQTRGGGGSGGDVGQCIIANGSTLNAARNGFGKLILPAKAACVPAQIAAQNAGGHFAAPLQHVQSSWSADTSRWSGFDCAPLIIC
jgi:hypothetical protein